jgi:hypothetical protein
MTLLPGRITNQYQAKACRAALSVRKLTFGHQLGAATDRLGGQADGHRGAARPGEGRELDSTCHAWGVTDAGRILSSRALTASSVVGGERVELPTSSV